MWDFAVCQWEFPVFPLPEKGNAERFSFLKSGNTPQLGIQDNSQGFDMYNVPKERSFECIHKWVKISGEEFQIKSPVNQGSPIQAIWKSL